ncbi:hypothetical protein [Marinobacter sp.]|uniref:hypothetical protein n=1 Tax=Marinobacter sp. TaxID=50741 RepID=UPI003A8E2A5F
MDVNGREVRPWTDALFQAEGLESYDIWCLSRGLARQSSDYKAALAPANYPRQGSHDGRGPLSEERLALFCKFMLETALDQVHYISDLMERADAIALTGMPERSSRQAPSRIPYFSFYEHQRFLLAAHP